MGKFTFTNPKTGQSFTVSGPETLTEAQAKDIFNKQLDTGALVGLKSGDVLNSAKQALGGVTGAIGSAISGVTGAVSGALGKLPGISKALTGGLPTSPINMGDLAKSAQGLMPMVGVNSNEITAGLAGLTKLVDQPASVISDTKGVGQFGLDANQLQTAGFLKPGTTNLLANEANSLTSVLSSPTVWTGKDGITNVQSLLSNVDQQSLIQQTLMSSGSAGLSTVGIDVSALNPAAATGTLLNAAKSVTSTAAWAKGVTIPSIPGSLPSMPNVPNLAAGMDASALAGAFGVKLSNLKANPPVLQEIKPEGAVDTVNRATLNAATDRVIGDPKIPKPDYGGNEVTGESLTADITAWFDLADRFGQILDNVDASLSKLTPKATITQAEFDAIDAMYIEGRDLFNVDGKELLLKIDAAWNRAPRSIKTPERNEAIERINSIKRTLVKRATISRSLINELKSKISG